MAKHSKPKPSFSQLKQYPVLLLFFGFLLLMFIADCITPFRDHSELENTKFKPRPTLTVQDLTGRDPIKKINAFFNNYSDFFKQQFAGRDSWINLHAACEQVVFQKKDYGNILLGQDGMEFARTYGLTAEEITLLEKNVSSVENIGKRYPGLVTTMVVPSAATIYPDKVPAGAPLIDENAYLDNIFERLRSSSNVLDVRDALRAHTDEQLFFRTDHHWTTNGAYYAYEALCKQLGLTPFNRDAHTPVMVDGFYGTSWAKSRQPNAAADTITYYKLDNPVTLYKVTGNAQFEPLETTGLYDLDKFETYDKYSAFLHGNNGFTRVQGNGKGRILVVKDSYANCFIPFLTENYETIDVVDFRGYNFGLDALIAENQYDNVLVMYSFASFKSDPFLNRLSFVG